MTTWLTRLRQLRAARADPTRIGDAAVLHSELLGVRMSKGARAAVERLCEQRGPAVLRPALDGDALRRLPRGTFGRALIDFCDANGIVPATISDQFDDGELRRMAATARYITTHDMFHVLLGCDTSIPGELRITGFILEQGYFTASWLWLPLYYLLALLLRPHLVHRSYANLRQGRAQARRASLLLAEPLEDCFTEDLERLRHRLGLLPSCAGEESRL
jgi:ubiquinone biosynthesis protein COQ4